jgi:Predicted periplasmic lipoprotein (DUF2279)
MGIESCTKRICFSICFILLLLQTAKAQPAFLPPSDTYRPDRLRKVVIAESVLFVVTSVGLYYLWYKKFPHSRFHFINDNREWFMIDKAGHATTAYTLANMHHDLMRWSGVKPSTAIATSAISSVAYMSIIELLDGFSKEWGFSKGDMIANISGAAFFAAQQHWWGQQRISMRVSASFSPFAKYNPKLLGDNWASRLMKDYNGQTYWLSLNIRSFLKTESKFPAWLNVAAGFGAQGMIGAEKNPATIDGKEIPAYKRVKQFYLGLDADFNRLDLSPAASVPVYLLQFIKTPAPAVEVNSEGKIILRPLQF